MPWIYGLLPPRYLLICLLLAALWFCSARNLRCLVPRTRIVQAVDDSRLTTLSGNIHPLARPEFDQGALCRRCSSAPHGARPSARPSAGGGSQATHRPAAGQYLLHLPPVAHAGDLRCSLRSFGSRSLRRHRLAREPWLLQHPGQRRPHADRIQRNRRHGAHGLPYQHASLQRSGRAALRQCLRPGDSRRPRPGHRRHRLAQQLSPHRCEPQGGQLPPRHQDQRHHPDRRSRPRAQLQTQHSEQNQTGAPAQPNFTVQQSGSTYYGVTPYDFATIYNVLPLWNAATPIDGTGQTIAIVGQTDINPADFVNFRKLFNLPLGNTATPTGTQYLNIIYNGPNPGVNSATKARPTSTPNGLRP